MKRTATIAQRRFANARRRLQKLHSAQTGYRGTIGARIKREIERRDQLKKDKHNEN